MDAISAYMDGMRITHFEAGDAESRTPWGVYCPKGRWQVTFYLLDGEPCRLTVPEIGYSAVIEPPSMCILLGALAHQVEDLSGTGDLVLAEMRVPTSMATFRTLRLGAESGQPTTTFYMGFDIDNCLDNPLLEALPPVLVQHFDRVPAWLEVTSRWLREELLQQKSGRRSMAVRLGELLMIEGIRSVVAEHPERLPKWLREPGDRRLERALTAIHRDITRNWTLDDLAAHVATSRARLCALANAELGEGLGKYIQRLRMFEARRLLADSESDLTAIARKTGYQGAASFITAFRRHFGQTPNAFRKVARRSE